MNQTIKKRFFTKLATACMAVCFCGWQAAAQTVQLKKGASSIELQCSSLSQGTFYYGLYNTLQSGITSAQIKTAAQGNQTETLLRSGKVSIGSTLTGIPLNRLITNLADTSTYYLYTFWENQAGVAGAVQSFTTLLNKRQQAKAYSFNSNPNLYTLYRPEAYLKDETNQTFPLLIACHGDGQTGSSNLTKFLTDGLPQSIEELNDFDMLIAAPQVNKVNGQDWINTDFMNYFLELIKSNNRIDLNRVYITGLSGGGSAVYTLASSQAAKVAGAIPFAAGAGSAFVPCNMKDVPFWGIHNSGDPVIGVSLLNIAVNQLNACSPAPLVTPLKTIITSNQHNSWHEYYRKQDIFQWLLKYVKNAPLNQAPVLTVPATVTADLSLSTSKTITASATDPEGATASLVYNWYKVSGPDVTVYGVNTATLNVSDIRPGKYKFRVTVKDIAGVSSFQEVLLDASGSSTNLKPVVSILNYKVLNLAAGNSTTAYLLSPVSAYDPDGVIQKYSWSIVSAPAGSNAGIKSPNFRTTEISELKLGTYVIQFKAEDDRSGTTTANLQLVVNSLPQVNAGADQDILITSANLSGFASDPDGSVVSVKWTGPGVIQNSTAYQTTVSGLPYGANVFTFEATDNTGEKATDQVVIYTGNPATTAPSLTITAPAIGATSGSTVTVTATSDPGGIKEVQFEVGNKSGKDLTSGYAFQEYNFPNGNYTAVAYALNNSGRRTMASVNFKVNTAGTIAPGVFLIVPTNGSSYAAQTPVNLAVNVSDVNGKVTSVAYFANGVQIASSNSAPFSAVWIPGTSGTYNITATATDNEGATKTNTGTTAVTITGSTNQVPTVALTAPANNSSHAAPASITLSANAADPDGTISSVKFYANGSLLGTSASAGNPYTFTWAASVANTYTITAVATDNQSAVTTSAGITVVVTGNQPPSVSLTSPAANSSFVSGSAVSLGATASDPDGSISSVDFYANSTLIGSKTIAPFTISWTPSGTGSYSLTARATDNANQTTISAPVPVTVTSGGNAPVVQITYPSTGQNVPSGSVTITAVATDPNGTISNVLFQIQGSGATGTDTWPDAGNIFKYTFWPAQLWGSNTVSATATDNNGNTTTSAPVTFTIGSARTEQEANQEIPQGVGVYPNPASGFAHIANWHEGARYELFSATGMLLKEGHEAAVWMGDLHSGMYLIRYEGLMYKIEKR